MADRIVEVWLGAFSTPVHKGPYPGDAWVESKVLCEKANGTIWAVRVVGPSKGWIKQAHWRGPTPPPKPAPKPQQVVKRAPVAAARQTSRDAYNEIKSNGMLSKRRMEAYEVLFNYGPMTSNEVFQLVNVNGDPNYRHNTNARMAELRTLGVIAEKGTKQCSISGNNCILWEVTSNIPMPPPKKPARLNAAALRGLLDDACTALEETSDRSASDKAHEIRGRMTEGE